MRRVAEGVYQRDGRYLVKWWEPDGKGGGSRKQETLEAGTTLAQAKTFKGDKERAKARPKLKRITADQAAERWMTDYRISATGKPRRESTAMQNTERVKKFGDDFAGVDLAEIDRAEARLWANNHPSRVKAVRAMFNDYVRDGYATDNPFDGLIARQNDRGRADIVVLTEAEVERLMEIARDLFGEYGRVVAGLIGFAAWTGGRPGELYALERSDVDPVNREVHFKEAWNTLTRKKDDPKWESHRTIAFLPRAAEIFQTIPPHPYAQTLFWTQRGRNFNSRNAHYYWAQVRAVFWSELPKSRKAESEEEALRERKIPREFDLYELRHLYASYLANELGATGREIAAQLGHKDGGRLAEKLYVHTEQKDVNARILERARRLAEEREARRASG